MVSCVEKIRMYSTVIREKNPELNAFLHVYENEAIVAATLVDSKIKNRTAGKLAGLVFGVKSCINVKGMITNCGSRTLENYIAPYDADVIMKIKNEDGIIIGMTAMDEFAQGSTGLHCAYGPTVNPICPERVPGGTSSGSAVAVAAGMCDVALGTDTGGSVRCPASHCGVVAVKPSYGRVSRYGVVDSAMSFDQVGVLAHNVSTVALVMEVIAGHSVNDSTSYSHDVPQYTEFQDYALKIGVSKELMDLCSHKDIKAFVNSVIERLTHKPVSVTLPYVDLAVQAYYPIQYTEFFSGTRKFDGRTFGKKIEESCGEEVLRRIIGGKIISQAEHKGLYYRKALKAKALIAQAFEHAFEQVDIILCPVMPNLAPKIDQQLTPAEEYASDALTVPANLAGICAGVVPMGVIEGCPVGVQILAPAFQEEKLLSIMKKVEQLQ